MKGILLSLGILIPTILPSQIRLVPFLGDLFSMAEISKETADKPRLFSSPFLGTFFQSSWERLQAMLGVTCFRPLFGGPFFQFVDEIDMPIIANIMVFVPFLGDFFSIR